jgi:hypothetical protein
MRILGMAALAATAFAAACTHTVRFETSDKPILINLNVNVEQNVRIQLEREIEDLIASNPDAF